MISEWFLGLAVGFVQWLAGVFGEWTPPPELTGASSAVNGIIGSLAGMGVWVAWPVLGACVGAAITAWAIVVGIKLVRAVIAHIPAFGGAGD
ncbi:hypothetical protein ASD65_03100 [Microbacterium sp. Root61]|uniref:hypothetical protein n=1 Tax=Microbacterium sp. Root61 TaxID=1736570 RepID=UPI0006F2E3E0|nr:hypothetical protein [Microbacterium sp. Root61]KRA23520.1 hypothetical protein ASD65_03100 [Microbacterium sp. Root61]